jgi:tRNA threonylcarbamoyladenosine modification (KEOPS) complex  Pcc1 subunit
MKAQAVVRLRFRSKEHLDIVLKALKPEAEKPLTSRLRVYIRGKNRVLTLFFEARDTSALRAVTNSYLRWVVLINDTWVVMEKLRAKENENLKETTKNT